MACCLGAHVSLCVAGFDSLVVFRAMDRARGGGFVVHRYHSVLNIYALCRTSGMARWHGALPGSPSQTKGFPSPACREADTMQKHRRAHANTIMDTCARLLRNLPMRRVGRSLKFCMQLPQQFSLQWPPVVHAVNNTSCTGATSALCAGQSSSRTRGLLFMSYRIG